MKRQHYDNRRRYDAVKNNIRLRYEPNAVIPLVAVRHLMMEMDHLRIGDKRTQDKFLVWLMDSRIMGEAVIEKVNHIDVLVLPTLQMEIEPACELAELVRC